MSKGVTSALELIGAAVAAWQGGPPMTPTVSILTYCAHPALTYGTLLTFDTLRIGFRRSSRRTSVGGGNE